MGAFVMPSLGTDMEAGILVEWLKQPGDMVHRGDIIAVVETEKGAIEVEIFEDGQLTDLLVQPGTKVPVGTTLAMVTAEGEAPPPRPGPPIAPSPKPPVAAPAPPRVTVPLPPTARRRVSPAARQLAATRGIDLDRLSGTGPEGAIVRADVLAMEAAKPKKAGIDLNQMRRAIAAAMARSKREIPHYYLTHKIDMGIAQDWLAAYNASRPPEERLMLSALLLKAIALAVKDFPEFNGFYSADSYQPSSAIHVGMAIAIRSGGLAAPAIHDTATLPLPVLMTKMRDLVGRVRRGGFRASELTDATITVSSLGDRGVESLLPIIYPPQVAILGFGTVENRPWAVDDRIAVRPVMTVTLAADHRTSDGHRGALLLRAVEAQLQKPDGL